MSRKVPRRTEKEAEEVPRRGIQETDHVQQLGGYLPLSPVQASAKKHGTEMRREQKGQIINTTYSEKTMCKDSILKLKLNVWNLNVFSCFEIWALFCSLYHVFEMLI